jgi:molecular chaperone DnaK
MAVKKVVPVGIDLGTTFSVVAHLDASGRPWTIMNSEGDPITPSVVFFDGEEVIVGKEAVKAGILEPDKVADFMKRDMGSSVFSRMVNSRRYPPEVLQSYVLKKLKHDAELKLGTVRDVVITVPAFFDEPRRKGTQDAGKLAGLNVLNIINEPTAAAIAYGVQEGFLNQKGESEKKEKVLVYDLGGGTFDVTLMEIDGKSYTAIATDGDVFLGGTDWDRRILDHISEKFKEKHGKDPRENLQTTQRLLHEAEDVKRALSVREQTSFVCECGGKTLRIQITRAEFEEMTADLLERTRFTTTSLLSEAGMKWKDVTRLLLVGGSSRMPMVQKMLEKESGRTPDRSLSADEAVGHGAAIYAGLILASSDGTPPKVKVRNVNSHNLGVLGIEKATGRTRNQVLIPRNTLLPVTKVSRFQTAKPNQQSVVATVVEGGDPSGNNATRIGKCVIRDLPKGLPAGTPVDVAFTYGDDGRLKVKARLPGLNKEATLVIERESGMNEDKLAAWGKHVESGKSNSPLDLDSEK